MTYLRQLALAAALSAPVWVLLGWALIWIPARLRYERRMHANND